MPINRLTAFSVLAAALLVVVPAAQATTSKTHARPVHAKHVAQHKQTHSKPAHHKAVHGKLAKATHKTTHLHSAASSNSTTADVDTPASADTAAAVETKSTLPTSDSLQPHSFVTTGSPATADSTPAWLNRAPVFNSAQMLVQSAEPLYFGAQVAGNRRSVATNMVALGDQTRTNEQVADTAASENVTDLRKSLITLAMKLRDIRYVRGGSSPSTGFDCSGFVRYVFAHAIGMQLPSNSASQFLSGLKVKRADMKPGDLVFFRTHGRRNISHVGIYISNGRFIHSPTTGKSVEISSLDEGYWAKRFAGAKRPEAIAMVANKG